LNFGSFSAFIREDFFAIFVPVNYSYY